MTNMVAESDCNRMDINCVQVKHENLESMIQLRFFRYVSRISVRGFTHLKSQLEMLAGFFFNESKSFSFIKVSHMLAQH